LCSFGAAAMSQAWPIAAITLLCAVLGATCMAWNGVFIAETASIAPPGEISSLTGGMQAFIALGALVGPGLCAAIVTFSGSYSLGYALIGLLPLLVGVQFLFSETRGAGDGPHDGVGNMPPGRGR